MRAAATPAPMPLSILTTTSPGAHVWSIARSARLALTARAVANHRRQADHRHRRKARDDRRQRAIHPRRDDQRVAPPGEEVFERPNQPVQPRHADIGDDARIAPHRPRDHRRLIRRRQIRRPCRDNTNATTRQRAPRNRRWSRAPCASPRRSSTIAAGRCARIAATSVRPTRLTITRPRASSRPRTAATS